MNELSDQEVKQIMKKGFCCIPAFVTKLHFDVNRPKFHNIYISNMRENSVKIYDGNKWILFDRNDVIEKLFDDKRMYLEDRREDLDDGSLLAAKFFYAYDLFEQKLNKNEKSKKKIYKTIYKTILYTLFNDKHIPLKTIDDNKKLIN